MKYYSKNLTNLYFSFITMLCSLIETMNNVVVNNNHLYKRGRVMIF